MLISPEYRELNRELHERKPSYGTSGAKSRKRVLEISEHVGAQSVLDYGCGKQDLGFSLPQLVVVGYDPALDGLDGRPDPHDLVVCGDVLEHIEPECLDAVMDDMRRCTLKAIYMTIATCPARKILKDGRNAHLMQEAAGWWLPKILKRWEMQTFENVLFEGAPNHFVVFATRKAAGEGR